MIRIREDNGLPGDHREVATALARAARGELAEPSVVVWGVDGAGKSHLLQAAVRAAAAAGRSARYFRAPSLAPAEPPELAALVAIDDVERADADAQARLFTLYNGLAGTGGQLVVAMSAPPARLPLRPDLRTRLSHGLVRLAEGRQDRGAARAMDQGGVAR